MAKTYKIRDGFTFVAEDRSVKRGGDTVDLEDDVARQHAHKLEVIESTVEKPVAKKTAPTASDTQS